MKIELSRRSFVAGAAAFGFSPAWAADEKPYLKVGFLTDTHLWDEKDSEQHVRGAFRIFSRECVDAVGHCGDLADFHFPGAYTRYRDALETTYPDAATRPQCLYAFGNHDALDPLCLKDPSRNRMLDVVESFKDMRTRLGFTHEMIDLKVIHGVPFVIVPESWNLVGNEANVEKKIREACALSPNGPVVLMTHETPKHTAYRSGQDGQYSTDLFSKYPQLVTFTGHSHNTLRNELTIWQGAFTAIDVGCLQWWRDCCVGISRSMRSYTVLVVEFFRNRLVLRRYDVRDGLEYRAERPWTVPVPHDPKNPPLSKANRAKTERKAAFAPDAAIAIAPAGAPFGEVELSFPAAKAEEDVLLYRLELARRTKEGAWEKYGHIEQIGEFHLRPQDRTGRYSMKLSAGFFDEDRPTRVSIVPVGFFGAEGTPLTRVWTMHGSKKGTVVWSSARPMEELKAFWHPYPHKPEHWRQGRPEKLKDGWLAVSAWRWLELPGAPFALPKGTPARIVVEARVRQRADREGLIMRLSGNILRVTTVPGDVGRIRYVRDYVADGSTPDAHQLVFCDGSGEVRVERISLERFN